MTTLAPTATAWTHTDIFAALDEAEIAAEFAKITGEHDTLAAAENGIITLVGEALNRGFILDALNCEVGDEVQNHYSDTGVITNITPGPTNCIEVCWDAPSPYPSRFTTPDLLTGALRHRR